MAATDSGIGLTVTGGDSFLKAMRGIEDPAARKELFSEIGSYLESSTQQRFIDEAGPDGKPWKQSLRAKDDEGQTLRDTGRLFGSITNNATENQVEVGSNVIYARIHQLGGVIKPKHKKYLSFVKNGARVFLKKVTIPARPYLGINDSDERKIEATVARWWQERFQ